MKPSAAVPAFAAALALAALLAPGAPLEAQTAPPSAPATGAPAAWRPLILVDPRAVLRASQHHAAPERKPTPRPRAHATAAPGEVFERYDTASPRPR